MSDLGGMRRKKAEPPGKQPGGEKGETAAISFCMCSLGGPCAPLRRSLDSHEEKKVQSHARLGTFLRRQEEGAVAEWWEDIDRIRQGGWYGGSPEPERVQRALDLVERIHCWAVS